MCLPLQETNNILGLMEKSRGLTLFRVFFLNFTHLKEINTGTLAYKVLARISKMPVQNSNSKISARPDLAMNLLQSLYQLHLTAYCVKTGSLHFSYILKNGLLGKYLVITPKKPKLKILHRNFCLSNKEVFRKLPVQKTGRTGPG